MDLLPIVDFVDANTDLVKTETLFNYSMPPAVNEGVMLVPDDGHGRVDHEIPGRYTSRFQVITRSPTYETAKARAYELMKLLRSEVVQDFGDYCTSYIRPVHLPMPYRRSDGDLVEFSVNFDTLFFTP